MNSEHYDDSNESHDEGLEDMEFEYQEDELFDEYNNDNLTVSSINTKREHEEEKLVQNYMKIYKNSAEEIAEDLKKQKKETCKMTNRLQALEFELNSDGDLSRTSKLSSQKLNGMSLKENSGNKYSDVGKSTPKNISRQTPSPSKYPVNHNESCDSGSFVNNSNPGSKLDRSRELEFKRVSNSYSSSEMDLMKTNAAPQKNKTPPRLSKMKDDEAEKYFENRKKELFKELARSNSKKSVLTPNNRSKLSSSTNLKSSHGPHKNAETPKSFSKSSTPEFIIFNTDPNNIAKKKGFQQVNKSNSSPTNANKSQRQTSLKSSRIIGNNHHSSQSSPAQHSLKRASAIQKSPKIKEFERVLKDKTTNQETQQSVIAYNLSRRKSKTSFESKEPERPQSTSNRNKMSNIPSAKSSMDNIQSGYFSTPGTKGRRNTNRDLSHQRGSSRCSANEKEEIQKLHVVPHSSSDYFSNKCRENNYSTEISPVSQSNSYRKDHHHIPKDMKTQSLNGVDNMRGPKKGFSNEELNDLDVEIEKLEREVNDEEKGKSINKGNNNRKHRIDDDLDSFKKSSQIREKLKIIQDLQGNDNTDELSAINNDSLAHGTRSRKSSTEHGEFTSYAYLQRQKKSNTSNIGVQLYKEGTKKLMEKSEEISKIKKKQEDEMMRECTFAPEISAVSKSLAGKKSVIDYTKNWMKFKKEKQNECEQLRNQAELKECTFQPTVKNSTKPKSFNSEEFFRRNLEWSNNIQSNNIQSKNVTENQTTKNQQRDSSRKNSRFLNQSTTTSTNGSFHPEHRNTETSFNKTSSGGFNSFHNSRSILSDTNDSETSSKRNSSIKNRCKEGFENRYSYTGCALRFTPSKSALNNESKGKSDIYKEINETLQIFSELRDNFLSKKTSEVILEDVSKSENNKKNIQKTKSATFYLDDKTFTKKEDSKKVPQELIPKKQKINKENNTEVNDKLRDTDRASTGPQLISLLDESNKKFKKKQGAQEKLFKEPKEDKLEDLSVKLDRKYEKLLSEASLITSELNNIRKQNQSLEKSIQSHYVRKLH